MVRLYVCMSVTLRHLAKAVGRNEMPIPFDNDTRVVPSNTVLDTAPIALREWEIWGSDRDRNPQSKFVLQIAVKPSYIAEWLL